MTAQEMGRKRWQNVPKAERSLIMRRIRKCQTKRNLRGGIAELRRLLNVQKRLRAELGIVNSFDVSMLEDIE